MALSCCVVEEDIADAFVEELIRQAKEIKIGPAWEKTSKLGPITYEAHYKEILADIEKGIKEGSKPCFRRPGTVWLKAMKTVIL